MLKKDKDSAFTLIELLVSISIISILAALAITSFNVYRRDAQYSRALADLTNARKAAEAGAINFPDGIETGFVWTTSAGGAVPMELREAMPGAVTSKDVQLGALFMSCGGQRDWRVQYWLMAQSCKSDERIFYLKFCNGDDVLMPHLMGAFCF